MKQFTFVFVLAVILPTGGLSAQDLQKGILSSSLYEKGTRYGEPGQLVFYSVSEMGGDRLDVKIGDKVVKGVLSYRVVPWDPDYLPSWAYVRLLYLRSQPDRGFGHCEKESLGFLLAKNISALFPDHRLGEELLALQCQFAQEYDACDLDEKSPRERTIDCLERYLSGYPQGHHRDRLEWELVQLKNEPYEYEGIVSAILSVARAYEDFLNRNSSTEMRAKILFTIAKRYRMAWESAVWDHEGQAIPREEAERFRQKALDIYEEVGNSDRTEIRERARVGLYGLTRNRRIYIGMTDWSR